MKEHFLFRTYQSVWSWTHRIFMVGDTPLWHPVSFNYVGLLVLSEFIVWFVLRLPPIRGIVQILGFGVLLTQLALPFVLAHWLSKGKLDGKPPFLWIRSQLRFLYRPQVWFRGRPIPTWWLGLPPVLTYQAWRILGWNPLPPEGPAKQLKITGAGGKVLR